MTTLLILEPLDTVFFRDHKPFSIGEGNIAEGVMPTPLTMFGALGDYFIKALGLDFAKYAAGIVKDDFLGEYDELLQKCGLRIKGPFLTVDDKLYFPSPGNLFAVGKRLYTALPQPDGDTLWDSQNKNLRMLSFKLNNHNNIPQPLNAYFSMKFVNLYLTSSLTLIDLQGKESRFFLREIRVGQMISPDTMSVEEGFLYSANHLRFIDKVSYQSYVKSGLAVFVNSISNNPGQNNSDMTNFTEPTMTMGGEGRRVEITARDVDGNADFRFAKSDVLERLVKSKKFFLYFITPAIFTEGWKRRWPADFEGANLVGAAANKPQIISGWVRGGTTSKGHARPIRKAVPAGSTYFFEAPSWNHVQFEKLVSVYHFGEPLSEEYSAAGFGTVLIGAWD